MNTLLELTTRHVNWLRDFLREVNSGNIAVVGKDKDHPQKHIDHLRKILKYQESMMAQYEKEHGFKLT